MKLVFDGRTKAGRAAKLKAAQEKMFGESPITSAQFKSEQKAVNKRILAIMDYENTLENPAREIQIGGDHYLDMDVQPWTAMQSWMTPEQYIGFLRGNAIKYLARCDNKGGLNDIRKAHHYLTKLIEFSKGQE